MKKTFCKQKTTISLAFAVILILCLICSVFGIVFAEDNAKNEISIIHVSDLHYYPTYMCYKQTESDYLKSAMLEKSRFESKLLMESSAVIKKLFEEIATKKPDYLVVTGDLSSDGERVALIEIANALRSLQNKIRDDGKNNFQIFVVPGNHDILNENATDYSELKGKRIDAVTKLEFVKIFAGLGYPNMTRDEAEQFYSSSYYSIDEVNKKYLPYDASVSTYVHSSNADNIDFVYNALSFDESFYVGGVAELGDGELSYIAKCPNNNTFIAIDGIVKGSIGGKVSDNVFNWLQDNKVQHLSGNLMTMTHHNVLPHFTMQEQWTKNYLYSNWEVVRDFMIELGVKYNFSGHMHANDVASYCNYSGYNLYDIETGSPVGYGAAYREATINFYQDGASDMLQTLQTIKNVDVSLLVRDGYLSESMNIAYRDIINNEIIQDLAGYIHNNLYKSMLDGVLDKMIKEVSRENFVELVIEKIDSSVKDGIVKDIITNNINELRIVLGNLYNKIQSETLANFVYTGEKEFLQAEENKLRAYIYNFASKVLNIEIQKNYTIQNMFVDAYTAHLKGNEDLVLTDRNSQLKYSIEEWLPSGQFVQSIVDILRSNDNGIAPLLKQVLSSNYDLTIGLSSEQIRNINKLVKLYDTELASFNLDKFIKKLAGDKLDNLPSSMVDKSLDYVLTQSIAKGIGSKLSDVVRSLATDSTYDGTLGEPTKVLYDINDQFSHYAGGKVREASITDGRLPSMLTMTLGENVYADRNLVWFTDKSVTGSQVQISEGDRSSFNPLTVDGSCEIIEIDMPLMDVGILATYTSKEIARHTASMKGLKADTLYTYRVGDATKGYFSDLYTFRTPITEDKSGFEMLIVTDMQGMTQSNYEDSAKMLQASMQVSEKGYDLILNLGDMVDSGKNTNQWQYFLDSGRNLYGTTPQVVVSGNHDIALEDSKINTASGRSPLDIHYNISDKKYYSFDYKSVHFVVLDTNDIVNDNLSFNQIDWLINDLQQNKDNLVVVAMHKGIYSAGPHRNDKEIINMRKTLGKLFSDYKVELVLQGHDHVYSESFYMDGEGKKTKVPAYNQGAPINNNSGGVLYITMGSSGNKYYSFADENIDYISKGKFFHTPTLQNPTFGRLVFDGENIKSFAYEYDLEKNQINQLKFFNKNRIALIVSIVTAIIIVIGVGILIFILVLNHKKKLAACIKENELENQNINSKIIIKINGGNKDDNLNCTTDNNLNAENFENQSNNQLEDEANGIDGNQKIDK